MKPKLNWQIYLLKRDRKIFRRERISLFTWFSLITIFSVNRTTLQFSLNQIIRIWVRSSTKTSPIIIHDGIFHFIIKTANWDETVWTYFRAIWNRNVLSNEINFFFSLWQVFKVVTFGKMSHMDTNTFLSYLNPKFERNFKRTNCLNTSNKSNQEYTTTCNTWNCIKKCWKLLKLIFKVFFQ